MAATPANNNFLPHLTFFNYDRYTSGAGLDITLTDDATINFYFLGSESGFNNTLQGPGFASFNDGPGPYYDNYLANNDTGAAPFLKLSKFFTAGSLAGSFEFKNPLNEVSAMGSEGFGVFLKQGFVNGGATNRFLIAFDDRNTGADDDNHDDFMILAVVNSVPEPATWGMLLFGFGALGAAMRRKPKTVRIRTAYA